MAITRSGHDASGSNANQQGPEGQQQPPPPPPPQQPPTWQQLYATQTEILRNLQHQYEDFLATHPPIFSRADEPLEADTWIRAIESKFTILATPCTSNRMTFPLDGTSNGFRPLPRIGRSSTVAGFSMPFFTRERENSHYRRQASRAVSAVGMGFPKSEPRPGVNLDIE
ncbi:hypothetical protein HU200_007498 [Digitaria exilis]|uniref:Uncharacterized protein n=1 Tax=Digitaria exilis TaxID=1010633 RepID=A0A835FPG3_9POAL|nr:hypothetical protein HU200_007498 [Digitaria exilis]